MSNDSVTKLPRLPHETRRLSRGHVDGVTAVWHRVDAIDAKLKLEKAGNHAESLASVSKVVSSKAVSSIVSV